MIEVEDLKLVIEPEVLSVLTRVSSFLAGQGIRAYLVGGFVRDMLLGRDTADFDIAVAADAPLTASNVAAVIGGKHVLLDEVNRVSRVVLDNRASAAKARLYLDFSTVLANIEDDLARRDFTINAMAIDLKELSERPGNFTLIDPFNGRSDLRRKVLRAVSRTVFKSDAVRLLRAVRLAAELDFNIEPETEALIQQDSYLAAAVAGERIREELLRLLAIPKTEGMLLYLDELGLVTAIIPELAQTKGVEQPKEHFWNVFDHSRQTVAAIDFLLRQNAWLTWVKNGAEVLAAVPWSAMLAQHFSQEVSYGSTRRLLLKLAALLHDIAKPKTKTIDASGRMRFFEHAQEGSMTAASVLERLRFSSKETKLVEIMVKYHLRPMQMSQDGIPSSRAVYRYFRDAGDAGIDTLFLSLADHLATRGPHLDAAQWRAHAQLVEYVLAEHFKEEQAVRPPKLVSGHDLINVFGLKPGPRIGELLEAVREAQADGEISSREEALAYLRRRLSKEAG